MELISSNDAVVRLDETYAGCSWDADGLCPVSQAVDGINERLSEIDFNYACCKFILLAATDKKTVTGRIQQPLKTSMAYTSEYNNRPHSQKKKPSHGWEILIYNQRCSMSRRLPLTAEFCIRILSFHYGAADMDASVTSQKCD